MKKLFSFAFSAAAVLCLVIPFSSAHATGPYSGGSGTSLDPYQLTTCADFIDIASHPSAHFIMENDIDCTSSGNAVVQSVFFDGDFNGNGHKLTLAISSTGPSSSWPVWEAFSGTLENLWIDGTMTDTHGNDTLGFIHSVESGTISNVKDTLTIEGTTNDNLGGLADFMLGGTIQDSYFAGMISGGVAYAGGIVYDMEDGAIQNSYSSGAIDADTAGGLAAKQASGTISNSFASGEISGTHTGAIAGDHTGGTYSGDYWDMTTTGQASCDDNGGSASGCAGVNSGNATPNYFKGNSTNAPFTAPWDFSTVWQTVAGGYPVLRGIIVPVTPTPVLTTPASSGSYLDTDPFTVSFTLPAAPLLGQGTLVFTPSVGGAITLIVQSLSSGANTFTFPLSNPMTSSSVLSSTAGSIPDGTYTVTLSYQDSSGDTAAAASSTNVVIVAPAPAPVVSAPVSSGGAIIAIVFPSAMTSTTGGSLDFFINGGSSTSASSIVNLSLNADPKTVTGYAVSLDPTFAGGGIMPYSGPSMTVPFQLPKTPGTYTIYVMYYSTTGNRSAAMSHSISYGVSSGGVSSGTNANAGSSAGTFVKNLARGAVGADVSALQKLLVKDGELVMPAGVSYGNFGSLTLAALQTFQVKYGIVSVGGPGYGMFGPKTRAQANSL